MRALAYSLLGMFDKALADYDEALRIKPDFPLALNNRAWAYYKLGRPGEGLGDVQKALELSPGSPYALDTRAHIHQALGDANAAFEDYELAMQRRRRAHREDVPVRAALAGALFRRRRRRLYAFGADRLCAPAPAIASAIRCLPIQNAAPKSPEAVHALSLMHRPQIAALHQKFSLFRTS